MFTATALANDQYLVEGTDSRRVMNSTVVDGTQWNAIKARRAVRQAHEEFDAKVEDFFAPITEAIEVLESAHKVEVDPLLYVVEQEGSEGAAPQREILTRLEPGSVILRAIESGQTDRLLWVKDELVLAVEPQVAAPAEVEVPELEPEWDDKQPAGHEPESDEG